MKKILFFTISFLILSMLNSCGCGDCMNCDGSGKAYYEMTGEVSCPDCGGDGCTSDSKNGDRRTGAEIWEDKYGK